MQTTRFLPATEDYPVGQDLPKLDPALLDRLRVDAHWVAHEGSEARARVSLWHRQTPAWPDERLGVIGHYAAADAASGAAILQRACAELAAAGCTRAVGPMDGDTWHLYRVVTHRGDAPPFFLEPWQPSSWPEHWVAAGFAAMAQYHSTVSETFAECVDDPRHQEAVRRVSQAGVRLRSLEPGQWEEELRRIYAVAAVSFRANLLYSPLPEAEFLAIYRPLRPIVRPEMVLIAEEQGGKPVGFALGLPDRLDPEGRTFIVKTVAVLPEHAGLGLGRVLVAGAQEAALALGFRRTIHALMHDGNISRHLSARFGSRLLRRYTLYSRCLT